MRVNLTVIPVAVALLLALSAAPSIAGTITGFSCLTGSDPGDCAIGEDQLSVEISDQGNGIVRFHFRNAGPEASAISEIYFDDGSLLGIASVIDGPGVDFEQGGTPPNLPGGAIASPPFQVTAGFLAQSVPSPSQNGVGPVEWVKIDFALQGQQDLGDVLSELQTGALRIGVHVIAFDSGGSESLINIPVPEPGTGLLVALGLFGLSLRHRRSS